MYNNIMVSRAYYPSPHPHPHDGLRYLSSRSCAPYLSYPERRYQLGSHDTRAVTMAEPQGDETSPPRKRIAVAVSPCPTPIITHAMGKPAPCQAQPTPWTAYPLTLRNVFCFFPHGTRGVPGGGLSR